jgi:hypothetical protein
MNVFIGHALPNASATNTDLEFDLEERIFTSDDYVSALP